MGNIKSIISNNRKTIILYTLTVCVLLIYISYKDKTTPSYKQIPLDNNDTIQSNENNKNMNNFNTEDIKEVRPETGNLKF